jgi:formylglycine-generating enzyme required for sulfatase activity
MSASASDLHAEALELERGGELEDAAEWLDRAFAIEPDARQIQLDRARVLDRLAVVEHGLVLRYVPAGVFTMGSEAGEADERPEHPVALDPFWITEVPVSWAAFCDLMGWSSPPAGAPPDPPQVGEGGFDRRLFYRHQENKIRVQYCESETLGARDWHAHIPYQRWTSGNGATTTSREMFGEVPRGNRNRPLYYDEKPMVAVAWDDAFALGERLSDAETRFRLPSEAEWEKAARGGLTGKRYPWGDVEPTAQTCDFGRFEPFAIQPPKRFAPNGYGLYGMAGGVWEWTADWYDAAFYAESPAERPLGPPSGSQKVLRGGSWADCVAAVRVSFRMALPVSGGGGGWGPHMTPNVGFRLVMERLSAEVEA